MDTHIKVFSKAVFVSLFMAVPVQAIEFADACKAGNKITIGAVGDIMFHSALQRDVYRHKNGFNSLWPEVSSLMRKVGVMYGNLESPAATGVAVGGRSRKDPGPHYDGKVYSGFPLFNVHPSVMKALKAAGVDLISTANNHAMDRGPLGADKTIDAANQAGLAFSGSRKAGTTASTHKIMNKGGWRIGWIACTYSTNGVPDRKKQITKCYNGSVSKTIASIKSSVDAVIVTPHWGVEYSSSVNSRQRRFARKWLNAGASAVLGAHPHVPQPWEKFKTKDGREGLIVYSLGNFVSTQGGINKRSSPLVVVGLSKSGGKAWVNGVRYLPLYMLKKPRKVVAAGKNFGFARSYLARFYGKERAMSLSDPLVTNIEC